MASTLTRPADGSAPTRGGDRYQTIAGSLGGTAIVLGVLAPWLIVAALVVGVVLLIARVRRRRRGAPATETPPAD